MKWCHTLQPIHSLFIISVRIGDQSTQFLSTQIAQFGKIQNPHFRQTAIMFRDISIQWEPLDDVENFNCTTDKTNGHSIFSKEISSLKADKWSLKLSLADSVQCSNNLQVTKNKRFMLKPSYKFELDFILDCANKYNSREVRTHRGNT